MSRPPAGGHHLLVDFWVDDAAPLREVETWEVLLPEACRAAGATVLGARFHQFQPEGVTGIVLLAESHASVHTWPEAGLVTLDVFTCGALDAAAIVETVRQRLSPVRERVTAVARGDVVQPETVAPRRDTSSCHPERAERVEGSLVRRGSQAGTESSGRSAVLAGDPSTALADARFAQDDTG
ncbi:adenosylmethionine decarboxylase [Rubrivirga marina]|uniref:S-adenosylmethionine decarboxylase proenzyme n=1 Tax=Rubrivirga marina TaxID=1196024 RepID=A0A271IYE3_9BACT|nr:adenosylmethionine decarboxylase [Rubrivirga marina]PAP76150.1 S-adenosylmethionine decarboxylase proenzyme [Rubrivirga marina]